MIIPPFLNHGDQVGIVATAKKVDPKLLENGVSVLKAWGLTPVVGEHSLERDRFFAGTDQNRLNDLQKMVDDPEIKAIFCARGGYGTSRIIDQLQFEALINNPKWVIGFSDITILHLHLNNLGVSSLHGPMPAIFHKTSLDALQHMKEFLMNGNFTPLEAPFIDKNRKGSCTGSLIGGNLSLIVHALGSKSTPDPYGKILLIEEVDEPLYKLDRLMLQLKRANILSHLTGLVVGHITNAEDESFGSSVEEVIFDHISDFPFPVGFGFPIGHEPENFTVPMGVEHKLEVSGKGSSLSLVGLKQKTTGQS